MSDLKKIVEDNFARYAGNVILDRAICDVRDMIKPSARMLMYSQLHVTKNVPSKPFVKSARVVGDALGHYYTHGDVACYDTYMRMAKPFAMRYPLEDCQGNSGTISANGDHAAFRYTELRLSQLGYSLFDKIEKNTINEWNENFDETDTYPKVLPSVGYYNIVNGTLGLGVSLSSSIPQFNLKEINNAMIELLNDQNKEINILPDFATGGIIINPNEVLMSLKNGCGAACKIRSVVEYNNKERAFVVKEFPYGVYGETISSQIQALKEENPDCGIDYINDGSGKTPDYIIYLSKKANPDNVLKLLYKKTSLQSHYTINMTVLVDEGRRPQLMNLKDMLLTHLTHEKKIYINSYNFDLKKIESRLHIIKGILICLASIDEVVQLIKSSQSTTAASKALQEKFLLDADQTKAILDMKLSRLAHLEVEKLEKEQNDLNLEKIKIEAILSDEILLKKEIENGLREVSEKFGDARRTKILNLSNEEDEVIEKKQLSLSFTNDGAVFVDETSSLYSQKRNGVGAKFRLDKGEFVVDNLIGENTDTILFFTNKGNYYHIKMGDFAVGEKQYLNNFVSILPYENIKAAAVCSKETENKNILFITKNGVLKKSLFSEYNLKRNIGAKALNLDASDEIVSIFFTNEEKIGILSKSGNFIIIATKGIKPIGRISRGVIGMGLSEGDCVVSARPMPEDTKEILSTTVDGYSKRTVMSEFKETGRGTKGVKIQKGDELCDFIFITDKSDILVSSNVSQIRVRLEDISVLSRGAQGTKTIKLPEQSKVVCISKF